MRARPSRTLTIGVNPVNIRYQAAFPNDPLALPVAFTDLYYASGGGTVQLLAERSVAAGTPGTGTLTVAVNPSNNETISVNGVTFTFKSSPSGSTEVQIGANAKATSVNFAAKLSASANGSITVASYSADVNTGIVTITYKTIGGSSGNAYTLADSSSGNVTRSGATLTGSSPVYGDGENFAAAATWRDFDQSIKRYAIASTGTVSLIVTDFEA